MYIIIVNLPRNRQRITEISQYIDLQREETDYWLSGGNEN